MKTKLTLHLAASVVVGVMAAAGCQSDAGGASIEQGSERPTVTANATAEGATLTQEQADSLAQTYLQVWQASDAGQRWTLVRKLFAEDAVHYVSPGDVSIEVATRSKPTSPRCTKNKSRKRDSCSPSARQNETAAR